MRVLEDNTFVWDIRMPKELKEYYNSLKTIGLQNKNTYFYKLNIEQAAIVVSLLSDIYNIPAPKLVVDIKYLKNCNALSVTKYGLNTSTIYMYPKNHIKTLFHEFYHHLDDRTSKINRTYVSYGGRDDMYHQFSFDFADKLYDLVRK